MSNSAYSKIPFGAELKLKDLKRLMSESEWAEFEQEMTLPPEEAERLLKEKDWLDLSAVNEMLGFTASELASSLGSVAPTHPGHNGEGTVG